MNAHAALAAVALAIGCGPSFVEGTPHKIGNVMVSVASSSNTWNLTQRNSVLADQSHNWWHNFYRKREGETPKIGGAVYVPYLNNDTDVTNQTFVAEAVAEAAESRVILSLGEFDGHGISDANAITAWCTFVTDPSILAHPEIKLASPYTVQMPDTAGGHFVTWLAGIRSNGCREPDYLTFDRYISAADGVADAATFIGLVKQVHAGFPKWDMIIPEWGTIGQSAATEVAMINAAVPAMDLLPYVKMHAYWFMGPTNCCSGGGSSVNALYDLTATINTVGTAYKAAGRALQ
jgi:hypothetical protein